MVLLRLVNFMCRLSIIAVIVRFVCLVGIYTETNGTFISAGKRVGGKEGREGLIALL